MDWGNTGGFQTGNEKTLIAFYTTGDTITKPEKPCVQCIAYSNDLGRTWTRYKSNPVLGHIVAQNRDPKVIWHKPTRKWIMFLFLDGNDYALFSSPDLKDWAPLCDINLPDTSEYPDIFELPVDGDSANTRWVFWGGNGNYYTGSFDGHKFQPESDVLRADLGANFYAAQTWSDIPSSDGRRLQIAWMSGGKYPDMPFNQQMSTPCELTLRTTPEGIRMYRQPVKEIESVHKGKISWNNQKLRPGENLLSDISGDLFDIRAEIGFGDATEVGFAIHGLKEKAFPELPDDAKIQTIGSGRCVIPLAVEEIIQSIEQDEETISTSRDGYASLEMLLSFHESERNGNNRVDFPMQNKDIRVLVRDPGFISSAVPESWRSEQNS